MRTFLQIEVYRRQLHPSSMELHVEWLPVDPALRDLCIHGQSFPFGVSEEEIADFGERVARPTMLSVIETMLPGMYE